MADFTAITTVLMVTGTIEAGVVILWMTNAIVQTRVFCTVITNELCAIVIIPVFVTSKKVRVWLWKYYCKLHACIFTTNKKKIPTAVAL